MSEKTGDDKKQVYKVQDHEFQPAEFVIAEQSVKVRSGVPFSALRDDPASWVHVAKRMSEGSILHITTTDHAWYARAYVTTVHSQAAKIHVLEYAEFAQPVEAPKGYTVEWGGAHKWLVRRLSDNQVMEHGFKTEADAVAYADELLKKLAA